MPSPEIQPPRFQWKKTEHGIWKRDIEESEIFYRGSMRKETGCYPVTGCASFVPVSSKSATTDAKENESEHYVEDAIRKAWITLCYEHPTLRSRVEYDEGNSKWKRVYTAFVDEQEQKSWFNSTFRVIDAEETPLEWFNSQEVSFEISTLFFVRSKKHHPTIFLRCPHDITDGVGVLQLVDQLFDHAAQVYRQGANYAFPELGNEHAQLSPCLKLAAAIPESFSNAQIERFREIQAQNGAIYNHPGLLGIPSSHTTATAATTATSQYGKRQRLPLLVPQATTEQILCKCKMIAPGVSVTHVFMSALAMALSELQPQKEESYPVRYVNHSMINLRPYCRDPYKGPKHAAAAYHTVSAQALGIDLVVPGSSPDAKNGVHVNGLADLAIQVRDYYKSVRPASSTDEQIMLAPLMFKSLTAPPDSDPHAVSDPPFCPVPLSSLGNINSIVSKSHGPFELTNVWAASEPIGAGVAVFLGTWDEKIELSAVFDTRYHEAEYIKEFLGRIVNCVCEGLGVGERPTPDSFPEGGKEHKKRKRGE
ncbi:hypothetical protein F5Y13DRAFT_161742 [Hypoxylon sp. FL1857]|nr:hypothetical protein F5Y13DRAFT_161742 [Hypoxylon sp. FL1857]